MTVTDIGTYSLVQLDLIAPAEDNLRRKIDERCEDFKVLAASIASQGVLIPLALCPTEPGRFKIVAGHRRYRAAQLAGLESVPAVIRPMDDTERQIVMLTENLLRQDLDPLEEAAGYFRCMELGLKLKELAVRVGRKPAHVSKRLALLELPKAVQAKVSAGEVTLESAAELVKVAKEGILEPADLVKLSEYNNPGYMAGRMVDTKKNAVLVAERVTKLTAKGIAAYPSSERDNQYRYANGWKVVDGFDGLTVDKTKHRKESCAVIVVSNSYSGVREEQFCKEPKRHTKAGGSELKVVRQGQSETEKARQAAAKELAANRAAAAVRVATEAAIWKNAPTATVEVFASVLFHKINFQEYETVCRLLDIAPDVVAYTTYGGNPGKKNVWDVPLARWLDTNRRARSSQLLWAWLLCGYSYGQRGEAVTDALVKLGRYELADSERPLLPRADATPEPGGGGEEAEQGEADGQSGPDDSHEEPPGDWPLDEDGFYDPDEGE